MNQVPSTYDFTQLQLLPFVTLQLETLLPYIADHSILYHFLRKQIMRFNLDIELEKTKIFEHELTLFLVVLKYDSTFIDGTQLYDQILVHMPLQNKFTFSINTWVCNKFVDITPPSNDDIRRSFIERKYRQVGFYANDNPLKSAARCHI
ncbi:unnamed protein product [Rotaria socialis]|uniref:Uncharacterized protein n=1 Tax=Rotaria socialis TaxID=392032 RepID=A0A818SRN7_9BILA|nr:unnamed protein product [Rotaria socialis]CAF3676498.1 unnamed protein product [Rotaria socialis]CAF4396484.1 unnamed protein product [Rotaria socialis]CAF4758783.1 unnamed protein product [Rotaria socialis]